MGSERTFSTNLQQRDEMLQVMTTLGDELLQSLAERQLASATLNIKVRFGDFETLTRAYTHNSGPITRQVFDRVLPYLLDRALAARADALARYYRPSKPGVRLLGVSFSTLSEDAGDAPRQLEIDV